MVIQKLLPILVLCNRCAKKGRFILYILTLNIKEWWNNCHTCRLNIYHSEFWSNPASRLSRLLTLVLGFIILSLLLLHSNYLDILFLQVFHASAIYFGIVCILGVTFNLGILLLYLSTKKVKKSCLTLILLTNEDLLKPQIKWYIRFWADKLVSTQSNIFATHCIWWNFGSLKHHTYPASQSTSGMTKKKNDLYRFSSFSQLFVSFRES